MSDDDRVRAMVEAAAAKLGEGWVAVRYRGRWCVVPKAVHYVIRCDDAAGVPHYWTAEKTWTTKASEAMRYQSQQSAKGAWAQSGHRGCPDGEKPLNRWARQGDDEPWSEWQARRNASWKWWEKFSYEPVEATP